MKFKVGDRVKYIGGYSPIRGRRGILCRCKNTWERYVKFDTVYGNYNVSDEWLAKIDSFGVVYSFTRLYKFPYSN
jgi:hypothetical protein